ncbi:MAG: MMPL family transporter [Deltaproteobacteria bacterium]|nr:MMPL family transporter [Deltaproteobacteria bacterium]
MRGFRRCAWPLLAIAVVLAVASVYYTVTNLAIRTSRNDLVASNQHLVQQTEKMDKAFGGRDGMVVVVENGHPKRAIGFANDLAAELRRYPDHFPELFYHIDPERLKRSALLYLDLQDLDKIKDSLLKEQDLLSGLAADPNLTTFYRLVNDRIAQAMIGEVFTGFLADQAKPELPDLSLLNTSLRGLSASLEGNQPQASLFSSFFPKELNDLEGAGYFFTENDKFLLFLVTPKGDGYASRSQDLALLRKVVDQVKARYPGLEAGVTGPDALEADEMSSSMKDITLATWLSLAGQLGLLILFFRSLRRTLVEGLVLVLGLCWTFGLVTLVVGHLNLLSLIFAPLMLGLTIDYGIHWFCRLEEEQGGARHCSAEVLTCTFRRAAPGIVYAGVAAIVSFVPLAFVGFKGLAELGLILAMGILVMLVATLLLVPALVTITEKCPPSQVPEDCPPHPTPFLQLHWHRPGLLVGLGVLVTALGGLSLYFVPFDLNPLHLQNPSAESVVWEYKLIQDSKYSTSYGALATASLEELAARSEALKRLPTVSHVESVLSFLPQQVEAKRPILAQMQPVLSAINFPRDPVEPVEPQALADILSRINFKVAEAAKKLDTDQAATRKQVEETHRLINKIIPRLGAGDPNAARRLDEYGRFFFSDLRKTWDLFRGYVDSGLTAKPPTLADLPQPVRQRFISPEGTYLIRVFPSEDTWNFGPLKNFVQSLWSVDPNAVGDPILLYSFTLGFRNSILWAAGMALLAITVMLVLLFRSLKMALLALIPLVVGTGLTINMMWLLNLPFNQANVLFVPLILGEGIEFGIIILARWRQEESARAITLPASTAKGVALAALTTTLGFGSLMVSGHQGTFSLGLLATVGSLSVLLASLSILPAFLRLVENTPRRQPAFRPYLSLGRWLSRAIRKKDHEKAALDLDH